MGGWVIVGARRWHGGRRAVVPNSSMPVNMAIRWRVAEPKEREFLMSITLQLPRGSLERIRRAASQLLDDSPDFRRLLESVR